MPAASARPVDVLAVGRVAAGGADLLAPCAGEIGATTNAARAAGAASWVGNPGAVVERLRLHRSRAADLGRRASAAGLAFAFADGGLPAFLQSLSLAALAPRTDDEVVAALVSLVRLGQPDPAAVRALVASIPSDQLARIAALRPDLVGPIDGMPVELRYAANRAIVTADLVEAEAIGATDRAARDRRLLEPGRQLLLVDLRGDGRVAEVLGDLDTADAVAVVVPGITNTIDNFDSTLASARTLFDTAAAVDPTRRTVVIAWLGYDTPGIVDAPLDDDAYAGATALRRLFEGLALPAAVRTTVVGHSYGSFVTAQALRTGLDVDAVAVFGSPGMLVGDAGDLGDTPIYAARAPFDPVSWSEAFGRDPSDPRFGATRLATGEAPDGTVTGHSNYFAEGSESVRNLAFVVTGQPDRARQLRPDAAEQVAVVADGVQSFIVDTPIDGGQWAVGQAADGVAWLTDGLESVLPDPVAGALDTVQSGAGTVLEYGNRAVDLGQRVVSPDLWSDVGHDIVGFFS